MNQNGPKVGEVWITKIPNTGDHRIQGVRPAIVVSHSKKNSRSPLITIIPLSRYDNKPQKLNKSKSHMLLKSTDYTWLDYDSIVLCEQETTSDKQWLINCLGKLNDFDLDAISLIKARSQPSLFMRAIKQKAYEDMGFIHSLFEENSMSQMCMAS